MFFDGRGVAIMTNGDRGGALMSEILATLAVAYDWPAFKPGEKTVVAVSEAVLAELAGTYRVEARGIEATVEAANGRLFISGTGIDRVELLPESQAVFFSREDGTRFTFVRENGRVVGLQAGGLVAVKVQ
jgi:hypothetical protein